jgi:hypothetical protein
MDCDTILLAVLVLVVIFLVFITIYRREGDDGVDDSTDDSPKKRSDDSTDDRPKKRSDDSTGDRPKKRSDDATPAPSAPATPAPSAPATPAPQVSAAGAPITTAPASNSMASSIATLIGPRGFYCTDMNNCYNATSAGPPAPGVSANVFVPSFTTTQTAYFSNLISGCTKSTQPVFNIQNSDALACDQSLYKILYP